MLFEEPKGSRKYWRRIIGIAAFVRTEITQKPSNVRCATLEKVF